MKIKKEIILGDPKSCLDCPVWDSEYDFCRLGYPHSGYYEDRPQVCIDENGE